MSATARGREAPRRISTAIHEGARLFGGPDECNLAVSLTARLRLTRLTWARQRGGARRPELIPPAFCVRRTIRTLQIAASPESRELLKSSMPMCGRIGPPNWTTGLARVEQLTDAELMRIAAGPRDEAEQQAPKLLILDQR